MLTGNGLVRGQTFRERIFTRHIDVEVIPPYEWLGAYILPADHSLEIAFRQFGLFLLGNQLDGLPLHV